jgi:uncharacterized protein with HEPN domain
MTLEDFVTDDRTYDAVVRNLQIIGEAVKQIPSNIRGLNKAITQKGLQFRYNWLSEG